MFRSKAIVLALALILCTSLTVLAGVGPEGSYTSLNDQYLFRRSWGGEGDLITRPYDVAVGQDDEIILANTGLGRLTRIKIGEAFYRNVQQRVAAVAVGGVDRVYATSVPTYSVQVYTPDLDLLFEFGSYGQGNGEFLSPEGIAIDRNGYVYVTDRALDRVQKFDSDGNFVLKWGSEGSGPGQFSAPAGIDVDVAGNILVADASNQRVQIFNENGTFLGQFGDAATFNGPRSVATDQAGHIYVSDGESVYKYDGALNLLAVWDGFVEPRGLATNAGGDVFIADAGTDTLQQRNGAGALIREWGASSAEDGRPRYPHRLAVDNDMNVYVTDLMNISDGADDRVAKYSQSGAYLREIAQDVAHPAGIAAFENNVYVAHDYSQISKYKGDGTLVRSWGGLNLPEDIDVGNQGQIYVVEKGANRIKLFDSNGNLLREWGSTGSGSGQFIDPDSITVDDNNDVFIGESINENLRIQKFNSDGVYLAQWPGSGAQFWGRDIASDGSGNVYVPDPIFDTVFIYDNNGILIDLFGESPPDPWSVEFAPNDDLFIGDTAGRISMYSTAYPEPDPATGLVHNGSFEVSPPLSEWAYGGILPVTREAASEHGAYAARLGQPASQGEQGQGEAWIHQSFFVDPDWERPLLTFSYNMFVNDIMDYSDFFVAIQDGVGLNHLATVLRDGYQPCMPGVPPTPGTDLGWRVGGYDLSEFKGQHIRLVFANRNLWPISWGIWTYVDDVRVVDAADTPIPPLPPGPEYLFAPLIENRACDPVPAGYPLSLPAQLRIIP